MAPTTNALCNGQAGISTIEVRGGNPHCRWNDGITTTTVYSLSVGFYTLVVTDTNGCTATTDVTITQPEPFNLNAVVVPVSCRGGANGRIQLIQFVLGVKTARSV